MIQRKYKKYLIVLTILAIIISILFSTLFFLDYGIVNTKWSIDTDLETFTINNSEGKIKDKLYLNVDSSSVFYSLLKDSLKYKIESYDISVEIIDNIDILDDLDNVSFLGIKSVFLNSYYYPWNSESSVEIFFYYSDAGNIFYYDDFKSAEADFENPIIEFNSSMGPQMIKTGDIFVEGSFNGFFSKPKIDEIILDKIVITICDKLEK